MAYTLIVINTSLVQTDIRSFCQTLLKIAICDCIFVNVGGYDKNNLAELHAFGLFVGYSPDDAKRKAKKRLLKRMKCKFTRIIVSRWKACLELSLLGNHYIHLQKSDLQYDLTPDWYGYHLIG